MYSHVAFIEISSISSANPHQSAENAENPQSANLLPQFANFSQSAFLFAFQTSSTIAILRNKESNWKVVLQLDIPEKANISCFEFLGVESILVVGFTNGVILLMDALMNKVLRKFPWNAKGNNQDYPQAIYRDPNKIGGFFVLFGNGLMLGFEGNWDLGRDDRDLLTGKKIGAGNSPAKINAEKEIKGGKDNWLDQLMRLSLSIDWKKKLFPKWVRIGESEVEKRPFRTEESKSPEYLASTVYLHPTIPELSFIWGIVSSYPNCSMHSSFSSSFSAGLPSPHPASSVLLPTSFYLFPCNSISAALFVKKPFFDEHLGISSVFAFISFDGTARLFDLPGKKPLGVFRSAAGGLLAIDFSQSGRFLCLSGQDDGILIIDLWSAIKDERQREEKEGDWWRVEGHKSFISKAICEEFDDGIIRVTAASMDSCISITEFPVKFNKEIREKGEINANGCKEEGERNTLLWNSKFEEGKGRIVMAENMRKINEDGVGSLMMAGKNLIACCYDGCASIWQLERK
jgi:hypothetical protein